MAFSDHFLDEVRTRTGLADLISRRVRLTRKGREHLGLCPFHKEKTPSFTVNEEKGFYHCFGCGAHGSVFDFLMQTDGVSFPEAVERLAGEAGMEVPRGTPEERDRDRQRQSLYEVMEAAVVFFERALHQPPGREALDYLAGRGLTEDTIKRFRLGFAPYVRGDLMPALARKGINEGLMVAAGLVKRPDDGRPPYDYFRGRIMFPISDRRGRVIAFGGRSLGEAAGVGSGRPAGKAAGVGSGRPAGKEGPKYLNSPETSLFSKGRVLYGLAQAQEAARKERTLIVTEGYMDVITLHQAGFTHAVAPLGTALTEDQIDELWRLVPNPILCFDGDAAGGRAAARAVERALPRLKAGYGLLIAQLPAGEDPDSMIKRYGADAMSRVLAAAQPISDVLWQMESRSGLITTPEDRAALHKRLKDHALRVTDPDIRKSLLDDFKNRVWPSRTAKGGRVAPGVYRGLDGKIGPATKVDPVRLSQLVLLAIIINHPEFFHRVEEQLGSVGFADQPLDELRQSLISVLSGETVWDVDGLRSELDKRGCSAPVDAIFRDPLVRTHRHIGPGAVAQDVEATWDETFKRLGVAQLAEEKRRVRDILADDLSPAAWARSQAKIEAAIEE